MSRERPLTIDLPRLARLVWARRVALLRFHVVVAVLAVATVLVLPRWYKSSATLVPAPSESLTLDLLGGAAGFSAGSILTGAPTAQDQLKMVVTSRAVADSIVREFGLVERWKLERVGQAREQLDEQTDVTTPREGQIIVSVEARSAQLAQDLASAFVRQAAREGVRLKTSLASQRRDYLQMRLADLETEIEQASQRIRAFEEEHGAIALPEQTRETMDAAATLQAQVALHETELAAARRYFTDQSPQVVLLRVRLGELRRQLDRIARKGGTLLVKGNDLPALKQGYLRLNREQMSLTSVSGLLRRAYEQARVEEANPVPAFSLLDAANYPERHSRPKRGFTVIVVLALAGAMSLGYLYWREGAVEAAASLHAAREGRDFVPVGAQAQSRDDGAAAADQDRRIESDQAGDHAEPRRVA